MLIWKEISIDEIKSNSKYSLVGGPFGSDLSGIHYVESGVPVIRGTNMPFDMKFSSEDFVFVSKDKANKLISNSAYPGDLIFTQRGTLGQVGIVPFGKFEKYIISQSQMKLTLDTSKADPLFVYYYFRTMTCRIRIEILALSSGVPHINLGILKKFKIPYPPLPIQHKIASILSAYDELIDNNKRRIKLLEEMAEEIYKEWFVRMRFPGYETCKFYNGEREEVPFGTVGALPLGWELKKVEDIFKTSSGGTPSREKESDYYGGEIDWIKTGELKDSFVFDSEEKISASGLKNSSAKLFPKDVLIMAMYGVNIGQLGISVKNATANQAVCVFTPLSPNRCSLYYSFHFFKSIRSHLFNISMGAAQQNLSQDIIKKVKYLSPAPEIINKYDRIANPLFEEIKTLSQKNLLLQQTRELLLPRLMSGKLSVEHLLEENVPLRISAEPEPVDHAKKSSNNNSSDG